RYRRLAHPVLDFVEREIEPFEESLGLDPRLAAHDVEIEPGGKHLVRAADDDRAYRRVVLGSHQRREHRIDQRLAQRIDRRGGEDDLGNIARDGITDKLLAHDAPPLDLAWRTAPVSTRSSLA